MKQAGLKTTLIATPQNATDLLGPATQASSADMIVPALGFTDCVPFARALDQIHYSKPVLSTPLCTFLPAAAYAGGDLPQWIYGIAQTNVHYGPDKEAKLYLQKGLKYGATVSGHGERLRRDRLGRDARHREDDELDPVQQAQLRDDRRRASRSSRAPCCWRRRRSPAARSSPGEPAACGNQTQFYNYTGKGKWKPCRAG